MKSILVLLACVGAAVARPQFSSSASSSSGGSQGVTVDCQRQQSSPGVYEFSCSNANPGTLVQESTLWVASSGSNQQLNVRVPNYNFREIIRAALQAGGSSATNVRIQVDRPQVESVVEGEFRDAEVVAPNVQITYDGLPATREVHYGGSGQPYAPLSRAISEPGAGRFKKEIGYKSKGDQSLRSREY